MYIISNEFEVGDRILCFYDVGIILLFLSGYYFGFREFFMILKILILKKGNN